MSRIPPCVLRRPVGTKSCWSQAGNFDLNLGQFSDHVAVNFRVFAAYPDLTLYTGPIDIEIFVSFSFFVS